MAQSNNLMTFGVQLDLGRVLPARVRQAVYGTYVVLALLVGAVQAGVAAGGMEQPTALTITLGALAFLAVPVTALAAVNTPPEPKGVLVTDEIKPAEVTPERMVDYSVGLHSREVQPDGEGDYEDDTDGKRPNA